MPGRIDIRGKIANFRRKFWRWVLGQAEKRLDPLDMIQVLDKHWWALVRYRLKEIASSDLGLSMVEMLFTNDEGSAVDSYQRDMRDLVGDVRGDRTMP